MKKRRLKEGFCLTAGAWEVMVVAVLAGEKTPGSTERFVALA